MQPRSTSVLGFSSRERGVSSSLRCQAYRLIKEKILCAELPPASLIDERQLNHQLKLGLTPIRQALQWLALENLVVLLPRRGTIVADLNVDDLQKVFEIRIHLVPYAVALAAARATQSQIAQLETVVRESAATIKQGNNRELILIDRQVQRLLAEATHNEFLIEELDRLYSHALRLWYINLDRVKILRAEIRDERKIVEAVKARDGVRARQLMHGIMAGFHRELMRLHGAPQHE